MEVALWIIAITEVLCFGVSLFNAIRHEKEMKTVKNMETKYTEFVEMQKNKTT